ncbi:MAG: hypothetical protein U5J83_09345 [Bryobacterales bacterium]|nr:hypothetical protein [Bryobacterales bacterium]
MCLLAASALLAVFAGAQPVRVGTEFLRYTPTGDLFPQDHVNSPVEALSPPLVRGMWNSFRIIVDVEPGVTFRLFLAQNPEFAMQTRVFREVVSKGASGWQVERREFTTIPFRSSSLPEAERTPERATYTFWLDVRPPPDYPSERLKLETQILIKGQWFIYPMEVRVVDLQLPAAPPGQANQPLGTLGVRGSDVPYRQVVQRFVCAGPEAQSTTIPVSEGSAAPLEEYAARAFDFVLDALAREEGREVVLLEIGKLLGIRDQAAWCRKPAFPTSVYGPEWPAVLRNRLLRLRGNPD